MESSFQEKESDSENRRHKENTQESTERGQRWTSVEQGHLVGEEEGDFQGNWDGTFRVAADGKTNMSHKLREDIIFRKEGVRSNKIKIKLEGVTS